MRQCSRKCDSARARAMSHVAEHTDIDIVRHCLGGTVWGAHRSGLRHGPAWNALPPTRLL